MSMFRPSPLFVLMLASRSVAQPVPTPSSPMVPGLPPDEYVDVTGDGTADLLITGHTEHVSDPQQPGFLGRYKLIVRTLPGTTVLSWSTQNHQHYYKLSDAERLDTGLIAKRIHFQQLRWYGADTPVEFRLLERPFGPGITPEMDGWSGTGEHYQGTLVLRSVSGGVAHVAAFTFELPYPYGRIVIHSKETVRVPIGFGKEGDPVPPKPKVKPEYDFGHEGNEPQVMIPPGIPPDEAIDLTSDDIPDVVLTGEDSPYHATEPMGTYYRGLRMLPGTLLLMARHRDGSYHPFRLKEEESLSPGQILRAMEQGDLRWADPDHWRVLVQVLQQRYGRLRTADEPVGWLPAEDVEQGMVVFMATQYGRPMMGCLELNYSTPDGEFYITPRGLVDQGQTLTPY